MPLLFFIFSLMNISSTKRFHFDVPYMHVMYFNHIRPLVFPFPLATLPLFCINISGSSENDYFAM
jgi:hypothetical protein